MARLVIVVNVSGQSIADFNSECIKSTKPHESIRGVVNELEAILAGTRDGTVQVTSRDTDPSVATSGTGSTQATFDLS